MNVKQLLEKTNQLLQEGKIDLDTEVIYCGEYNYGDHLLNIYVDKMAEINEDEVISEPKDTLCFSVDSYVFESEDIGNCNMFVDQETYNDFLNYKE